MTVDARFVDVSCRGLRLGEKVKLRDTGDEGGFLDHEAPMPVGSWLHVQDADGQVREARVVGVVEQDTSAKAAPGMRIAWRVEPAAAAQAPEAEAAVPPAEENEGPAAAGEGGKKGRRKGKKGR